MTRARIGRATPWVAGPALAAVLVWAALVRSGPGSQGSSVGMFAGGSRVQTEAEGRAAPSFELPALEGGRTISLSDFGGKVVVLNFWASWCNPCREEAPHLERVWREYRSAGVQFLGVNHQDQRGSALAFQEEVGWTYPSGYDPAGRLALRYGLLGLPSTVVVGHDGRIVRQFLGKVDTRTLRSALDETLERGSGVSPALLGSIGA